MYGKPSEKLSAVHDRHVEKHHARRHHSFKRYQCSGSISGAGHRIPLPFEDEDHGMAKIVVVLDQEHAMPGGACWFGRCHAGDCAPPHRIAQALWVTMGDGRRLRLA